MISCASSFGDALQLRRAFHQHCGSGVEQAHRSVSQPVYCLTYASFSIPSYMSWVWQREAR